MAFFDDRAHGGYKRPLLLRFRVVRKSLSEIRTELVEYSSRRVKASARARKRRHALDRLDRTNNLILGRMYC